MKFKLSMKKQFIIFFLLVAAVSLIFLSMILKTAIEQCFHDYVWTSQTGAHEKIVKYLSDYYSSFGTWDDFEGKEIGNIAKAQSRYFSLYDPEGKLIFSTENDIEPCCSDPNHKYWNNIYPVMSGGKMAARVNIGQFTDHIYSPEDIAFRRSIIYGIGLSLVITLLIALPLSLALSSRLSKPIRDLKNAADTMASGDLTATLKDSSSIDEISGLTSSINRLRKSLYDQETMRKEMASDISHELRTPVNIIQNQLEGMIDGVLPTTADRLEGLLKEMHRLTGLIGELEKITEIETASSTPIYEEINISDELAELTAGFEGAAARKGIFIKTEIEKDIFIKCQRDKLAQVVINLISNAYKFTDTGGLTVKLFKKGEKIVMEVKDTGIGITKEDLDKIYERFYRVDKSRSRNTGGAGLGLAIVKSIADSHKWKLETESEKDKGSVFRIIF